MVTYLTSKKIRQISIQLLGYKIELENFEGKAIRINHSYISNKFAVHIRSNHINRTAFITKYSVVTLSTETCNTPIKKNNKRLIL